MMANLRIIVQKAFSFYRVHSNMCPLGYIDQIEKVKDDTEKGNSIATFVTGDGQKFDQELDAGFNIDVTRVYGKESLRKQIGSDEELEHVESKPVSLGRYTVIAFTLDGSISRPLIIDVSDIALVTAFDSSHVHYTTPWIFQIPQVYVLVPVLFWSGISLTIQYAHNLNNSKTALQKTRKENEK